MNNIVKYSHRLSLRYSIETNKRSNKKPANEFKLNNLGGQNAYMQREIELCTCVWGENMIGDSNKNNNKSRKNALIWLQ